MCTVLRCTSGLYLIVRLIHVLVVHVLVVHKHRLPYCVHRIALHQWIVPNVRLIHVLVVHVLVVHKHRLPYCVHRITLHQCVRECVLGVRGGGRLRCMHKNLCT